MANKYPNKMRIPICPDSKMGVEEGSRTVQADNISAALDAARSVDEELILVSTRAKDKDGKWQTSIGVMPISQMEDGAEIHISGSDGDAFKLVVSRALRNGLDPKTPIIPASEPLVPATVSITPATDDTKQTTAKKTSSAGALLMLAGLLGGTFLAVRSKINELSVRVPSMPEVIEEEVVSEALEETV